MKFNQQGRSLTSDFTFTALMALAVVFLPGAANSLPARFDATLQTIAKLPTIRVVDVCETWYVGRTKHWTYCKDGFVCSGKKGCKATPEMQKKIDSERAAAYKAFTDSIDARRREINQQLRDVRRWSRSVMPPKPAGIFDDRRANCSDITGLGGSSAPRPCKRRGGFAAKREGTPQQRMRQVTAARNSARETVRFQNQILLPVFARRDALGPNDPQRDVLNREIDAAAAQAKSSGIDLDHWVKAKRTDAAPRPSTGASTNPAATPTNEATTPNALPSYVFDCEYAQGSERRTAAWYYACAQNKEKSNDPADDRRTKELSAAAEKECRARFGDTRFGDNILRVGISLYATKKKMAAAIADTECRASRGESQPALQNCIYEMFSKLMDGARVKGAELPDDPKEWVEKQTAAAQRTMSRCPPPQSMNQPGRCCPPGTGMKPTPGGFGSWSCQPLGTFSFPAKRNADASLSASPGSAVTIATPGGGTDSGDRNPDPGAGPSSTPENDAAVTDRELGEIAGEAAYIADDSAGTELSDADRKMCWQAAFDTAHAILKDGPVNVPPQCQPVAQAARAALARIALESPDGLSAGAKDLLSALASLKNANKGPPISAEDDACSRILTEAGGKNEGNNAHMKSPLSDAQAVPDMCKPYLGSFDHSAAVTAPSSGPAYAAQSSEVRAMAAEFQQDGILPPGYGTR